ALFGENANLPTRNHIVDLPFDGTSVSVARTGYTGEDGVEVFFRAEDAAKFWNSALEEGKALGIKPCGLGARDTLRLEVCYPLNGSDLSPERNPIEAGLGFFVDLTKPNFIGREVVSKMKENGSPENLVTFRMQAKGPPPRPHYPVFDKDERVGEATSDIYAPAKGTVVEVNKALEADPGLLNREPFGEGWIFVLKIDNPDDLKQLKDAAAYRQQIG